MIEPDQTNNKRTRNKIEALKSLAHHFEKFDHSKPEDDQKITCLVIDENDELIGLRINIYPGEITDDCRKWIDHEKLMNLYKTLR